MNTIQKITEKVNEVITDPIPEELTRYIKTIIIGEIVTAELTNDPLFAVKLYSYSQKLEYDPEILNEEIEEAELT